MQEEKGPSNASTAITSAVLTGPLAAQPAPNPFTPGTPALPEHCEVVGRLNDRLGANGQRYAIQFRLRLPTAWNGRFFFQGGGGTNGVVGNAVGPLQGQQHTAALGLGYAVVSHDSGHDNTVNDDPSRSGTATFGFDPQARVDFGYHSYDLVTQLAKTLITTETYRESVLQFMKADSTDLSGFKTRGGKLIIVHGVSDPVFSIQDIVNWWNEVETLNGGQASRFVRLFAVPGMNHCAGGPATDQFDAFAALVDWVEEGRSPDRIIATARSGTPWPGRTRPLCAYPTVARYSGTGSIEDAESFVCQ